MRGKTNDVPYDDEQTIIVSSNNRFNGLTTIDDCLSTAKGEGESG
jgi:hypothetical protein